MPLSDYPNLTGDEANLIAMDVAQSIPPEESTRLKYGPEELAFYRDVKEQHEAKEKASPHETIALDIRE